MKKRRIKFLDQQEVKKLIESAKGNKRDYAILHTLFSTGLRVSECVALRREDFERGDIDRTKELSIIGKGGWQRPVFFSPECMRAIYGWLEARKDQNPESKLYDKRLFPITSRSVERMVRRYGCKVGIDATPHTFRHSLATHLLKQGANIRVVQEILGHRALSSTMCYTGVTNKDLMDVHSRLV